MTVDQKWYSQVFTVDQRLPILQFFYQRWFEIIDRRSEMILTTDVRPSLPRFTLISPNWLLICALTVFEIKIYFHFVIPCSKCPWYQYWCALQQYLMSILGITFPCQFRCSSWLAWFNLEISAIIMHLFSSTFHHTFCFHIDVDNEKQPIHSPNMFSWISLSLEEMLTIGKMPNLANRYK